jgi:hypothetical protein
MAEELRAGIARRVFPTRNGADGQGALARFSATIGLGWFDGSTAGDPGLSRLTQTMLAAANDACMAGKRQGCDPRGHRAGAAVRVARVTGLAIVRAWSNASRASRLRRWGSASRVG